MSKLGMAIRQKYSVPGGPDETKSGVSYPMHSLSRESRQDLLTKKMRDLARQRGEVRMKQKFTGGLYADSL